MYPRRHCWGSPEVEMTLENMAMAMGTNTASRSRNEIHCHTRKGKALCVYEYSVRRSANAAHQQRPNPATLLCQSVHQRTQWGLAVTCMLCAAHICLHLPLIFFASLVDAPSLSSQCLVASRPHPTRAGTGISCPSRMRSRTRDAGDPSRGLSELLHGSTAGKGQWRRRVGEVEFRGGQKNETGKRAYRRQLRASSVATQIRVVLEVIRTEIGNDMAGESVRYLLLML
ncbi:hypothetical protein HDV62DRAFT_288749 [Trichoderma sp. SZMC 28011]